MNAPITALALEIWWRGKRSMWLALTCVAIGAFVNLVVVGRHPISEDSQKVFDMLFGMLMTMSFLLLMGIFNYTEYNSTKEWNGFPYRLFTLPLATWQLVTVPMFLCIVLAELIFFAWMRLVLTHEAISMTVTEWLAVVLGAYVIFYQTALWCLAGFRILRIVALALGGVSWILIASAPFFLATLFHSPWLTVELCTLVMIGLAMLSYMLALTAVQRQRHGGGRRWSWTKALGNWLIDVIPTRTRDFTSPAAAQFWFEWRRTGWLLPASVAFVILIMLPFSWFKRHDADFTYFVLVRMVIVPLVLSFVIGKGFVKCEFWSTSFGLPNFLAARPISSVEFVKTKMKVAALSAVIAWLLVFAFLSLWLGLWANVADLREDFYFYRLRNPDSWLLTHVLAVMALILVSWRLMVGGLWIGLSGNRSYYIAWSALPIFLFTVGLIAVGPFADKIDSECATNDLMMKSLVINGLSWFLAAWIIVKSWFAALTWSRTDSDFRRRYSLVWAGGLAIFLTLAISASPSFDIYRRACLYLLAALLGLPLARIAMAPSSFAKNRRQQTSFEFRPEVHLNKPFAILATLVSGAAIVLAIDPGRFAFRYVDAGGHPVRMLVSGHGNPAVVFEAGSGVPLEGWDRIQPAISRYTTTVSYDRTGIGWSPDAPGFQDARRVAIDLHTALRNAGVPPPYLLVGHSLGGPYNRVFAGMYPKEVCGMVLVDPTQEEMIYWNREHDTNNPNSDFKRQDQEWKEIMASLDEAHASHVPPGVPVVLITGMGPKTFPSFATEKKIKEYRDSHKLWLKFHQEWVDKIPGAKHIIDENTGHDIPFMEPEIVINALSNMIVQVNNSANSPAKSAPKSLH